MAPLRILFVHHRPELGGAPMSLSYLIRQLDRTVFEPHVFCPPGPAAELFEAEGAIVHTGAVATFTHIWASRYEGRRWAIFGRELARLPWHVRDLRRVLRAARFDVVHLNDSPLLPAAFVARRERIPIVCQLRAALPDDGRDLRSRFISAMIRRHAAAILAINEDVARSFHLDAVIVPNSVDLERFSPGDREAAKRSLGFSTDRSVVAYFGFMYPSKGFREFIRTARRLRDRGVDADYLIVGGAVRGSEFFRSVLGRLLERAGLAVDFDREARALVDELALAGSVHFVPFTPDTASLYRASDLVVAPSRGPEIGRPVIEAAATGIPVVASGSATGAGLIVPGETGVLVQQAEIAELEAAITTLLSEPEVRASMGSAARAHALETFDPARNALRVERIYRDVADRHERTRILFIHHRPQLGGAPSSLAELIRALDPRFEAHVLAPDGPAAELFERVGAIVHRGEVPIFRHAWDSPYAGLRWLALGREVAAVPNHIRQLSDLLRTRRFDIVHLNDSPLLLSAALAHRHGAKVVWHLRSALAGQGLDRRSRAIARLIDRWGDAAIAIDEDVAARFHVDLPVEIVPNSVRIAEPSAPLDASDLGLPPNQVSVGYAGFVRREKGWPELVGAARLLADEDAPVHFVVNGGGVRPPEYFRTLRGRIFQAINVLTDEESAMKELVVKQGLADRFSFLPYTPSPGDVYRALDVVTFPNPGVGLGRPVLEAAAYGKPVVASGSRDGADILVPEETALLVPEPTPRALADALRRLIDDPALRRRLGEAAARHAIERFEPAANARKVERVYDRLLGVAAEPVSAVETPRGDVGA
jgi:glycosyltransferase involved in cell wall biosynthesis